jgi:hypothetical protein
MTSKPTTTTTTTTTEKPQFQYPFVDFSPEYEPKLDLPTEGMMPATPAPLFPNPNSDPDTCRKGFNREDVKGYWKSSAADTDCPRSMTNAVFLDQLKRFAILKMNALFNTRTKSLEQVGQLLGLMREVMGRTCPERAVSADFLDVALSAFTMFIKEDFFYGVEELENVVFERFKFILNKCAKRAQTFVFSMEEKECDHSEVSGRNPFL